MPVLIGVVLAVLFLIVVVMPVVALLDPFITPALKWYFRQLDRLEKVFANKDAK